MEPFRLKLKVGSHEFEAEGNEETVKEQFAVWRELIASPSASPPTLASPPPGATPPLGAPPGFVPLATPEVGGEDRNLYAKIFRHDGRVVSLTVPTPAGAMQQPDALLVLLLGQQVFNGVDSVTGQQLSDGMAMSGLRVERVDRSWGGHLGPYVLKTGENRATRYRLNNAGAARAREIAKQLLEMVP